MSLLNALCIIDVWIQSAHEYESVRLDLIDTNIHLAALRQDGGYQGFPCHVFLHDQEACG